MRSTPRFSTRLPSIARRRNPIFARKNPISLAPLSPTLRYGLCRGRQGAGSGGRKLPDQSGRVIVVANSGDYNATEVYLYDGQKIIETRDGSGNVVQQFIHGTRYIDELVMMRAIELIEVYR